jgi:hypothetical protein
MLYGLFLSARKKPFGEGNQLLNLLTSPSSLLLLFIGTYAAIHLLTWALIRYRLPVDAALIPFAAMGIQDLYWRMVPASR